MKLQDLLKDIELGKVYTDKDRKPFKVNEDHDKEGKMAKHDAMECASDSKDVSDMIQDETDLPEWLEAKITISKENMNAVKDYLTHHTDLGNMEEGFGGVTSPPPFSSKEAKVVVDDALRKYSKELRKLQGKVVKDWMTKAKAGVIDFFDLVRGFQKGDMSRAYPYEVEFLMSVLTKDKIIDRFRKYFGGTKAMNNRTATKRK